MIDDLSLTKPSVVEQTLYHAVCVALKTPHIRAYLIKNDPQALRQLEFGATLYEESRTEKE